MLIRLSFYILKLTFGSRLHNECVLVPLFLDDKISTKKLNDVDVHDMTGLIKLFFRSLPESLFTDSMYKSFVEGIGACYPFL